MAEKANIALLDTQATPVSHTFAPSTTVDLLTKWVDNDSSVPSNLRPEISLSLRPGSRTVKRKSIVKLRVPYQPAAVDGITPAIEFAEYILTTNVGVDAPTLVLNDLNNYLRSLIQKPQITDTIDSGLFPY